MSSISDFVSGMVQTLVFDVQAWQKETEGWDPNIDLYMSEKCPCSNLTLKEENEIGYDVGKSNLKEQDFDGSI